MEPYRLTATQVVERFKSGSLTVEQYARSLLSRIGQRDSAVKAWAFLDPELVMQQARQLDKVPHKERGPLHGVAVGVKDVIYTKGVFHTQQVRKRRQRNELTRRPRHANPA